ncbi:PEP-CTERM sorting domain-containing protein [Haloferula sargassicola]|uniref:Ice-binding protein C-terminal domain-containing protein n=1 Tax=Haloferula sargassicola TaxID=490096 RepID=A0ABP9UTC8_9BACT
MKNPPRLNRRHFFLAGLITIASSEAAIFSENFDDGNAASRWSVVSQQEGITGPDGSVDFAFDYSTLGLSNPAGGSDTTGAFLQFNKTDNGPINEGESYSIYPTGGDFSGIFRIDLDMFVYNDGGGGSTEHGMIGIFLNNADPVSPYEFGTNGGPLAWVYSGEGGDGTGDLGVYKEGSATSTGYNPLGDYADNPLIPGFDATSGPAASNPRGAWVDVTIRSNGTLIEWLLNGAVVDTYDNSGGYYTNGNLLIGGMDVFNSANANNGVIVDNIVVTVPEPSMAMLSFAGLVGFLRRKRGK